MQDSKVFFEESIKKIIFYYISYCLVFLFIYLTLVSLVTFFNFLLEHDIGTIENWLTRNGHDLMTLSKGLSFYIIFKVLRLNNHHTPKLLDSIKPHIKSLTTKDITTVIFLNIFFIFILYAFASDIYWSKWPGFGTIFTSMLGTIFFYLFDILMIGYLKENFLSDVKRSVKWKVAFMLFFLFILSSLVAIPYMKQNIFYLFIYGASLFLIVFKTHSFWGKLFFFLVVFIGISSVIHGHDLMWGNNFKIIYIENSRSILGHFFIWSTGMVFYFHNERLIKFIRLKIGIEI